MSIVGRVLESISRAASTGMHSTADIPGLGASAEFTVFFWLEDLGGNSNDTLWADEDGGCQIFLNSSTSEVKARYSNSSSGGTGGDIGAGWNAIAVHFGLNIIGSSDVDVDVYRTASSDLDPNDNQLDSSSGGGPAIESDCTHYILGDDAGGGNTDDGVAARIANICLVEGIWSLDELGVDTTTGQAKAFDSAAEAAIVYAIRGIEGTVGYDDSGNGNHFTVESSGVTHLETGLPPGMSLPGAGSAEVMGAGLTSSGVVAQAAVTPSVAVSAAAQMAGGVLSSATVIPAISVTGDPMLAAGALDSGSITPAVNASGDGVESAGSIGAGAIAPSVALTGSDLTAGGTLGQGAATLSQQLQGAVLEAVGAIGIGSVTPAVELVSPSIAAQGAVATGDVTVGSPAPDLAGVSLVSAGAITAGTVSPSAILNGGALIGSGVVKLGVVGLTDANPAIHAIVPATWRTPDDVAAAWRAPQNVNATWRAPAEVAAEWKDVA